MSARSTPSIDSATVLRLPTTTTRQGVNHGSVDAGFVEDRARHARMMACGPFHSLYLPINERMPSVMNGESAISRSSGKTVI